MDKTQMFNLDEIGSALIETVLDEVYDALKEKGYNPVSQIVGYLISGDIGYITNYKDARKKIKEFDRTLILEAMVANYLGVR